MTEQHFRQVVRGLLTLARMDPVSVENTAYPGTPDINFTGGWLELKCVQEFPKRAATVVDVPTFSPQQRVWLRRRWEAGGGAWMLLWLAGEWQLFNGSLAAERVGHEHLLGLQTLADMVFPGQPDPKFLASYLRRK